MFATVAAWMGAWAFSAQVALVRAGVISTKGGGAPDPKPKTPPGLGGTVDTVLGWIKWGGLAAGVAGLMFCGIKLMLGMRNRSNTAVDGATHIPWVIAGLSLIAMAPSIVNVFVR